MSQRPVYLFNPENDLALGAGTANYTPAANVVAFHKAAYTLPMWYSKGEEAIVIGQNDNYEWLKRKRDDFGLNVDVVSECGYTDVRPCPWGWSANAVRQFHNVGISDNLLPDREFTDNMRMLSHRRVAAEIAAGLQDRVSYQLPVTPVEASSIDDVMAFVGRYGGCFLKSPWSGSGRGVIDSTLIPENQLLKVAAGVINRQGSVMLEQRLDKVLDFASLFKVEAGHVVHVGYSAFFNETANAYGGNRVMGDEKLSALIKVSLGADLLTETIDGILPLLDNKFGQSGYEGYFGVDMMTYRSASGEMSLAPVIEVNLRMTMGVVAWRLCRDVLADGKTGVLRVCYAPGQPYVDDYVARNGRLESGVLSLIPPAPGFRITLSVDRNAV